MADRTTTKQRADHTSPTVLLLIDVINDLEFDGGEDLLAPAMQMAQHLAPLKAGAKAAGIACIHVNDNWGRWRSHFPEIVDSTRGTRGWPVASQLLPENDDYFVLKAKHSGFRATPLDLLLRHLEAKRLIITGLAADNCVLFTASDAYMHEYELVIPRDCVASEQSESRDAALAHMERVLKARIVRAEDVLGLVR